MLQWGIHGHVCSLVCTLIQISYIELSINKINFITCWLCCSIDISYVSSLNSSWLKKPAHKSTQNTWSQSVVRDTQLGCRSKLIWFHCGCSYKLYGNFFQIWFLILVNPQPISDFIQVSTAIMCCVQPCPVAPLKDIVDYIVSCVKCA